MNIQSQLRQNLAPEDQQSEMKKTLTDQNTLIAKVEKEIKPLKQLLAFPQELIKLLIEGVPLRNKLFLQNNDYIEPIFKD